MPTTFGGRFKNENCITMICSVSIKKQNKTVFWVIRVIRGVTLEAVENPRAGRESAY